MAIMTIRQLAESLEHLGAVESDLVAIAQETAMEGHSIVVEEITKSKLVDSGALRNSVNVQPTAEGAILSVGALYAGVMEEGRRPGAKLPPLDAIYTWVVRKGIAKEDSTEERDENGMDEHVKSVAIAIQRTIAIAGIRGRHYFRRAMKKVKARLRENIKEKLAERFGGGEQ